MTKIEGTLRTLDEMVACGKLRYDRDRHLIDSGSGHRPRPTLLRDPSYVALRRRMQRVLADVSDSAGV